MRTLVKELIEAVILALLIFLGLQFSVQNFKVEGSSMEPTIGEGEYLLVNKLVYFRFDPNSLRPYLPFMDEKRSKAIFPFHPPRRGEVIIFHFPDDPSRDFVKRVIGIPGDTVRIHLGSVYVNDEKINEPYLIHRDLASIAPLKIPQESYFVLGDNRRVSDDSRDWGLVPAENLVGRAWVSYWPLGQWHMVRNFSGEP